MRETVKDSEERAADAARRLQQVVDDSDAVLAASTRLSDAVLGTTTFSISFNSALVLVQMQKAEGAAAHLMALAGEATSCRRRMERFLSASVSSIHSAVPLENTSFPEVVNQFFTTVEEMSSQLVAMRREWQWGQECLSRAKLQAEDKDARHTTDLRAARDKIQLLRYSVRAKLEADKRTQLQMQDFESDVERHVQQIQTLCAERVDVVRHVQQLRRLIRDKVQWDEETNRVLEELSA
jgi:hypothetical protein